MNLCEPGECMSGTGDVTTKVVEVEAEVERQK